MDEQASTAVADLQGEITISRPRSRSYLGRTHETALTEELAKAGIGFFRPVRAEIRRYANGRRQKVYRKLYPRMIFIDSGQLGRDVADKNHRVSAHHIIPKSTQAKLRGDLVRVESQLGEDSDEFPTLKVGSAVCVTGGAFRGKEGYVESRDKKGRFTVRLAVMSKSNGDPASVSVEIDAANLEAI